MMTPSNWAATRRKKEAGQSLIITAVSLVVLLALVGFGVDIGILRYEKRLQQNAADAAAIAGADDLAHECLGDGGTDCTDWSTAAQNAASGLGFTNGTNNVTVTANNPPASGPHAGNSDYVEAIVSAIHPTFFERIVGVNQATVVARAVATYNAGGGSGTSCWWDLGAPAKGIGVDPSGSVIVDANCGIVDNGNYDPKGGALRINTCSFAVAGTDSGNGSGSSNDVQCDGQSQQPTYGGPTQEDPLYGMLTPPTVGSAQAFTINAQGNAYPGTYSGINIPTGTTVNFQPGVYVVTGSDFECQGSATVNGNGVTFYFTNGATIQCTGNVTWDLSAPNSNNCSSCPSDFQQYGILMWQDPCDNNTGLNSGGGVPCNSNQGPAPPSICPPNFAKNGSDTGPEINGNTSSSFGGVLYFPRDQLYFSGNSGTVNVDTIISDSSCLSGNATIDLTGTAGLGSGTGPLNSVLSHAVLVE